MKQLAALILATVLMQSAAADYPSRPVHLVVPYTPGTRADILAERWKVETWYALFAPAGTPSGALARLNTDINSLLSEAQIRDLLAKQGMAAAGGPPERLATLVKSELARWSRVVAAAKIKAD